MALSRLFNDPIFGLVDPIVFEFPPGATYYGQSGMMPWTGEGAGAMERGGGEQQRQLTARPRCDVYEDNEAYHIRADMPGMSKDDVKVDVTGDTLTIRGDIQQEEEKEGTNWHRRERRRGTYLRAFTLPEGVSADHIDAKFDNGALHVTLPKPAPAAAETSKRSIEIK